MPTEITPAPPPDATQTEMRLGPVGVVISCDGCGIIRPPGPNPCPACGFPRKGRAGAPYPAGRLERFVWCYDQNISDRNAFATLLALAYFDGPNGKGVFPSMRHLARTARLSERVTRDGVRWLEKRGWIVCEQRRRGGRQSSNRYSIRQAETCVLPAVSAGCQAA